MNLIDAAKQALEALEQLQGGCTDSNDGTVEAIAVWCPEIIESLRKAIAQAENAEPSCEDAKLAEMIMSDCGCSTENTRLLERITNRIACLRPSPQPLTDDQWLDYLLKNATKGVLHIAAYHGESMQSAGRWVLRHDANELRKLVEAAHNITNKNHDKTNVC